MQIVKICGRPPEVRDVRFISQTHHVLLRDGTIRSMIIGMGHLLTRFIPRYN